MIYRQVIPPAPAYLGLNLYLKGSPMLSKHGGGIKKEKSKDTMKTKIERRTSQSTKEQPNATENATMSSISPRNLIIDFTENLNDQLAPERKTEQLKSLLSNGNGKSPRNRIKFSMQSHRETAKIIEAVKNLDSARRHASCGPRIMSVVAAAIEETKTDENAPKMNASNYIKCIGNKCGPENTCSDSNNNQIASTISSPRKTSLDTPRTAASNFRGRLKPLNALSKTNAIVSSNNRNDSRTMPKAPTITPANVKEYRKSLTQSHLNLNKLPSKLPINDHYYNSHFFAVGLSLKAWRSKYSRIRGTHDRKIGTNSHAIEPTLANTTTVKNE